MYSGLFNHHTYTLFSQNAVCYEKTFVKKEQFHLRYISNQLQYHIYLSQNYLKHLANHFHNQGNCLLTKYFSRYI